MPGLYSSSLSPACGLPFLLLLNWQKERLRNLDGPEPFEFRMNIVVSSTGKIIPLMVVLRGKTLRSIGKVE